MDVSIEEIRCRNFTSCLEIDGDLGSYKFTLLVVEDQPLLALLRSPSLMESGVKCLIIFYLLNSQATIMKKIMEVSIVPEERWMTK